MITDGFVSCVRAVCAFATSAFLSVCAVILNSIQVMTFFLPYGNKHDVEKLPSHFTRYVTAIFNIDTTIITRDHVMYPPPNQIIVNEIYTTFLTLGYPNNFN